MLSEETQQQLIQIINQQLDTDFIILFGSFAKGTEREDSDIDLAYFSKKQLSSYERFILSVFLGLLLFKQKPKRKFMILCTNKLSNNK